MVDHRRYSEPNIIKLLYNPFATNYGLSPEVVVDYWLAHAKPLTKQTVHNPSRERLLKSVVPLLKNIMGCYANFFFISVIEGGGGANFINHYSIANNGSTPEQCASMDANYILSLMNTTSFGVDFSASETGNQPLPQDNPGRADSIYKNSPAQSLARYYMAATLAGNGWNWCHNWCMAHQPGWGDAYSDLIDIVKSLGANPVADWSNGGKPASGNIGGNEKPPKDPDDEDYNKPITLTPGAIYLSGTRVYKLEDKVQFNRNRSFLYVDGGIGNEQTDEDRASATGSINLGKPGEGSNPEKVNKILKRIKSIFGKKYYYSNQRPAGDLLTVNWADCSGFVGWLLMKAYPWIWNGGHCNTGTIFAGMKAGGCQVFYTDGGNNAFKNWAKNLKNCDVVLMSDLPGFPATLNSHVSIIFGGDGEDATMLDQNIVNTDWARSVKNVINWYQLSNTQFKYWCVMRIK